VTFVVPPILRARIAPFHASQIARDLAPLDRGTYAPREKLGLLILCFTNRCGSNYLAALLAATGAFNNAGEFFNADVVLHHSRTRRIDSLRGYFSILPQLVENVCEWLAAKASIEQIIMLADAGIFDRHPNTRFILLERQDLLAQAISRCIAAQNDRWISGQQAEISDADLIYDRAAIDQTMADVAQANAAFRLFFAANGIAPIHLAYEHVVKNPQAAISRIGESLGISSLVVHPDAVRLHPQSSTLNAAWRARYESGL
jgi:LPS sulfotransferase NodH